MEIGVIPLSSGRQIMGKLQDLNFMAIKYLKIIVLSVLTLLLLSCEESKEFNYPDGLELSENAVASHGCGNYFCISIPR